MGKESNEEIKPDFIDYTLDKDKSEVLISDTEKEKIICELDSRKLSLKHKKCLVWTLYWLLIILYGIFIWSVFYVILYKEFTPYTLIPISLVGIIPTAIAISILRGLYSHSKEQKDDSLSKLNPVGVATTVIDNIAPQ